MRSELQAVFFAGSCGERDAVVIACFFGAEVGRAFEGHGCGGHNRALLSEERLHGGAYGFAVGPFDAPHESVLAFYAVDFAAGPCGGNGREEVLAAMMALKEHLAYGRAGAEVAVDLK